MHRVLKHKVHGWYSNSLHATHSTLSGNVSSILSTWAIYTLSIFHPLQWGGGGVHISNIKELDYWARSNNNSNEICWPQWPLSDFVIDKELTYIEFCCSVCLWQGMYGIYYCTVLWLFVIDKYVQKYNVLSPFAGCNFSVTSHIGSTQVFLQCILSGSSNGAYFINCNWIIPINKISID